MLLTIADLLHDGDNGLGKIDFIENSATFGVVVITSGFITISMTIQIHWHINSCQTFDSELKIVIRIERLIVHRDLIIIRSVYLDKQWFMRFSPIIEFFASLKLIIAHFYSLLHKLKWKFGNSLWLR